MEADCIVVFLDVYGFKVLVSESNVNVSELLNRLTQGHETIRSIIQKKKEQDRPRMYAFSDSIVLCYGVEDPRDRLTVAKTCIGDVRRILDEFIEIKLPLRGGVAFGKMTLANDMLLGQPLIRAVDNEQKIDAPLVLLPEKEMTEDLPKGYKGSISDLSARFLHVKDDQTMKALPILPRNLTAFQDLIREKLDECMKSRLYKVATAWYKAMIYTRKLQIEYRQRSRDKGV